MREGDVPLMRDGRFAKRPYGGVLAELGGRPAPLDSCLRRNDEWGVRADECYCRQPGKFPLRRDGPARSSG